MNRPALIGAFRLLALLAGLLPSTACASRAGGAAESPDASADSLVRVVDRRIVMGVEARITTWAPDEASARIATLAAFARMAALEDALSDYRPGSEAMRAVETVDEPVVVSPELAEALRRADEWHRRSGGAYDPTIGPVTALWRACREEDRTPSERELDFARTTVGWSKLQLLEGAVRFRTAAMRLDFGGVGKGLAADLGLEEMRRRGLARSLVEVGGDLVAGDPPPGRDAWRVTVETVPWDDALVLDLVDAAVATSGDVTQYMEVADEEGRVVRLGHLLDPRSGRPVTVRRQVTAVVRGSERNGAEADMLASVAAILGLQRSVRVADGGLDADLRVVEARRPEADDASPADWSVETLRFRPDPDWTGSFAVETLCAECRFTEGPVVRADGSIWFTDQPRNRIVRWSGSSGCATVIEPAMRANGLAVDAEGRLVACAESANRLVAFEDDGSVSILASGSDPGPARFNGPNDLWVGPDGSIWFTDPWYPRSWHEDDRRRGEPAVHRWTPETGALRVATGFGRPNGIVGTGDGLGLFVADVDRNRLWRYPIEGAGLGERRLVLPLGSDGMTLAEDGSILLTGRGVHVVDPVGRSVIRTLLPDEPWCANVAVDGTDLVVTAGDRLLRLAK